MNRKELSRLFEDASEQFEEAMSRRDFDAADLAANAMLGVAHDIENGFEQRKAAFDALEALHAAQGRKYWEVA